MRGCDPLHRMKPEMRWRVPRTTTISSPLPTLFQTLAAASPANSTPSAAAQIHQQLLVHGLLSPFLTTKLLQIYADASSLPPALALFATLPSPNVFAFTALLAALSRSSAHRPALALYAHMRSSAIFPDPYALPVALRSAAPAHPSAPAALHSDALRFSLSSNPHVRNALISAYSAAADPSSARSVFDDAGFNDLLAWNSIIAAYAAAADLAPALALLRSMPSHNLTPDTVTWNTVLHGYCRAGRCAEAHRILLQIPSPDVVSWTTVILGHARSANHDAALSLFRLMVGTTAIPPDQDTLSCALASCRHVAGGASAAREIHAYGIKSIAGAFYCSAGAALVALYASRGLTMPAWRVFNMMDPTDPVTWNSAIAGFVHAGMGDVAAGCFRAMRARGINGEWTTISALLPCCELAVGREIHAHVVRNYYETATEVLNALISMYARAGCVEGARKVFELMREKDVVTWNAMVGAYGVNGMGKEAVEVVREMGMWGEPPNAVTVTSALAACSRTGMVDEGMKLWREFGGVGREQCACVVDMLARAGRFEEAVGVVRELKEGANGSGWGALLAAASRRRGELGVEYGRVAFEELLRLEPGNAGNYVTMAGIYADAGRWEEAKEVRWMMERRGVVKPSGYSWIEGFQKRLAS